ncbi:MAG: cobalt transporter [Chloroflexi bacterium]|nr:cobalt transporter [Chloroflexota bacterium]
MKFSGRAIIVSFIVIIVAFAIWGWLALAGNPLQGGAQPWSGVDENVIERFAAEGGREARQPLINTDQGDLLLFIFALGGAVGGFTAGYCWRMLTSEKRKAR